MIDWNEDLVEFISKCWREGRSAGETQKLVNAEYPDLNMTRNMVIGKWQRIGLKRGMTRAQAGMVGGRTAAKQGKNKYNAPPKKPSNLPRKRPQFQDIEVFPHERFPVEHCNNELSRCQWPYGDVKTGLRFCGNRVADTGKAMYCAEHLERAYIKDEDWKT